MTHIIDERISFSTGEVDGRELGEEVGGSEDRGDVVLGVQVRCVPWSNIQQRHRSTLSTLYESLPQSTRGRGPTMGGEMILSLKKAVLEVIANRVSIGALLALSITLLPCLSA